MNAGQNTGSAPARAGVGKWLLLLLLIVLAAVAARYFQLIDALRGAFEWVDGLGSWGPLLFIGLFVVCTVLFVPGSIFTMSAGVLFGVVRGSAYISVASVLAGAVAFSVSRYLARAWVAGRMARDPRFKAIDDAVGREGWKIVALVRLSPIFPFNVVNCLFGVSKVSLREFLLATWVGLLPGTVMYAYIGSLAGSLASLGQGNRARTPLEWALYGLGLGAALVLTFVLTRLAKKALDQKITS